MAEFCLKCFNQLNGTHYTKGDVIVDYDLCEGCGEYKKCIVMFRGHGPIHTLIRLCINLMCTTDEEFGE